MLNNLTGDVAWHLNDDVIHSHAAMVAARVFVGDSTSSFSRTVFFLRRFASDGRLSLDIADDDSAAGGGGGGRDRGARQTSPWTDAPWYDVPSSGHRRAKRR